MQLSNRDLKLQPVFDRAKKNIVAIIKTSIISTDKGLCLGLLCVGGKVIAFNDLFWDEDSRVFYVHDTSVVCSQNEVVRLDKTIRESSYFKQQAVATKSGSKVGKLRDFIFDPKLGHLVTLVVKRRVWLSTYTLFIHKNNILEASPKQIIVRDSQALSINELQTHDKKAAPKLRTALGDVKSSQDV